MIYSTLELRKYRNKEYSMLKKSIVMGIVSVSLYANTAQSNKIPKLKMYSCGITRVAFIHELTKAFEKESNC